MRTSFNDGWTVQPWMSIFGGLGGSRPPATPVTLPHDAVLGLDRAPSAAPEQAYFPGGAFEYTKSFDVPHAWRHRRVSLKFDGVYRDAMVYVNGGFAAQRPYGYSGFTVPLDRFLTYGTTNVVRVDARVHQDSRWYSGGGIYRDVHLVVTDFLHLSSDGVRISTPDIDERRAVVDIATDVKNDGTDTRTVRLVSVVTGPTGDVVARGEAPVTVYAGSTAVARLRMFVASPELWDIDNAALYTAVVSITSEHEAVDSLSVPFGIRRLQVDPVEGLRINGRSVKLRGACIHHDNGILGAATIARAEFRRVELLKAAGFNAIRSSHHPASPSLLEACDRLGMLVIDETFDIWLQPKTAFDYALAFADWWERDVEAMVAKDYNHPSVVFYSIGNEIPETGDPHGSAVGRELAEKVRSLDSTRFLTNGINGLVSTLAEVLAVGSRSDAEGVNDLLGEPTGIANPLNAAAFVTSRTAESFAILDVAGMNYGEARYEMDEELFPNRVIMGTETFPNQAALSWGLVERLPHVIGDFTWTGFDYLGEVGLGRQHYADGKQKFLGEFPWMVGWCGDLDITGFRRPMSYYRAIVFGLASGPYIAVLRPTERPRADESTQWSWSDSASTWSWDVPPKTRMTVEVYADADEVELILNDVSLGRRPAGRQSKFISLFEDVPYELGCLKAVAYRDGTEISRSMLRSAVGPATLNVEVDRAQIAAHPGDLAFVTIELQDAAGTLVTCSDRSVHVQVQGAAALQALGSARPVNDESFLSDRHRTFEGRALAAVRPTGPGPVTITVSSGDEVVVRRIVAG